MIHRLYKGFFFLFLFGFISPCLAGAETLVNSQAALPLGKMLPLASSAPFVLLLLCIAILPLMIPHWWEHNKNKAMVSAALAIPFALYLTLMFGDQGKHELIHAGKDYFSFMSLLASLFIISGGIYIKGSAAGTPLSNCAYLAVGAVLANLIGTTGASMLLIRPFIRANEKREHKVHLIVFFIFIVSNCGGLLTPLGDPPLFLGFLKGVPFTWTFQLWKEWLTINGILVILFNFVDEYILNKEEIKSPGSELEALMIHEPMRIEGAQNILFLGGIVAVIVAKGQGWGFGQDWPFGLQEGLMIALAFFSYLSTDSVTRSMNKFTFSPIIEVSILFAGIFITMIAPLLILNEHGKELGLVRPWHYFWATGSLSSFLDNAPTYLAFASAAAGQFGISVEGPQYVAELLTKGPDAVQILMAISCGSVFMGANTYIGNGPNFMVKAIAEENGIKMPSFFGYMVYSVGILIPIFIAVTWIFFR
jgi:Na+/H+ antiporter NhaD/arsenite permease-like protein